MTWARVTRDGAMMPKKTCGGCGGPVVRDAGDEHQIGRTARCLSINRARAGLVKSWTALCNQIRDLLTKFGFVLLVGPHQLRPRYVRGKRQAYCDFQDCRAFDICYTAKKSR